MLSEKTKTILGRTLKRDVDQIYPDRQATPLADGTFPVRDTGSTYRIDDEVPSTTKDMNKLYEWEYGEDLYGTQAKENSAVKEYRKDINTAYGKEDKYKDIYVDTYTGRILVSKQLKDLKK